MHSQPTSPFWPLPMLHHRVLQHLRRNALRIYTFLHTWWAHRYLELISFSVVDQENNVIRNSEITTNFDSFVAQARIATAWLGCELLIYWRWGENVFSGPLNSLYYFHLKLQFLFKEKMRFPSWGLAKWSNNFISSDIPILDIKTTWILKMLLLKHCCVFIIYKCFHT